MNYAAPTLNTPLNKNIHLDERGLIDIISKIDKNSELYHCYYNLEPRDSFKDYQGKMNFAFGLIHFDFDSDPADQALDDSRRFCTKLEMEGISFRVYFSGNKGFHVSVSAMAFGLIGEFDKLDLEAKMKTLFLNLQQLYPTIDTGIWNANRKFRSYRSLNKKSGLYKIEIPHDQLDIMNLERIRELAKKQPSIKYDPYIKDAGENEWAKSLYNTPIQKIKTAPSLEPIAGTSNSGSVFETFKDKKCILGMSERQMPQFNRHDIGVRLLAHYKNIGYPESKTLELIRKWAKEVFTNGDTNRSDDMDRMVKDAYHSNSKYSYGCYDDVKKAYCTSKCSLYNKLDREKRAIPLDSEQSFHATEDAGETKKHEQIGFYFRYRIPRDDGGIKIVDVPQYKLMGEKCFEDKKMCFNDSKWLKFDGKKWVWFEKLALSSYIIRENKECIKPQHLDNFAKMIKGSCQSDAMELLTPDGFLNVQNGIVDIKESKLLPHSYKYMFKYCSPVDFDPEATCPTWEKFLLDTFKNNFELIDLAQRLFGYILLGGRPFLHKAFVLYGEGRNGKSTFLDIMKAVIGKDSYSIISMSKIDREFSLVALDGKLANIAEETPTDEINAEVFKTLVGGGEVTASHKGFDEYQFQSNARFVFACNEMPIFKDKSVGLEDRLVFVPFQRYLKEDERDTTIFDRLMGEISGILNWAIQGARIVASSRTIPTYKSVSDAKELYREETDALYAWFKEEVEVTALAMDMTVKAVYEAYKNDCDENGNRPYSKDKFAKRFRKMLQVKCDELKIEYDHDLKDESRSNRIFKVVKLKKDRTAKTAFGQPINSAVQKNRRDYD